MKNLLLATLLAAGFTTTAVAVAQTVAANPPETKDTVNQALPGPVMPKTSVLLPGPGQPVSTVTDPVAVKPLPDLQGKQRLSIEDEERLFSLYEENPTAYFDELRKVTAAMRQRDQELNSKVLLATTKFRQSKTAAEKKQYLAEITALTRQQFQNRSSEIDHRLWLADKRLRELHNIHDFRKQHADEIINRRIDDLIREPGLKW